MATNIDDFNYTEDVSGKLTPQGLQGLKSGVPKEDGTYDQIHIGTVRNDMPDDYVFGSNPITFGNLFQDSYSRDDELYDLHRLYEDYSVNNLRGEVQPWYEQLAKGAVKMGVLAGTTYVDGTVGLVAGLINMAVGNGESNLYEFISNPVTEAMDKIVGASEEWMPNYKTKKEENQNFLQNAFSTAGAANFWGDSFLKNVGFTLGALASGGAWTKIPKLIMGVQMLTGASGAISSLVATGLSSATESAVEARNSSSEKFKLKFSELEDTYKNDIKHLGETAMAGTPEYDNAYNELTNRYQNAKQQLESSKIEMANLGFIYNMPYTWASHVFQFGKIMAGGWNTAGRNLYNPITKTLGFEGKIAGEMGNYSARYYKGMGIAKGVSNILVEASQEGMQEAFSRASGFFVDSKVQNAMEYYATGKDVEGNFGRINEMEALMKGMKSAFIEDNESTFEQMFIGGLTGGLGMAKVGKKNNADAWLGKNRFIGLHGGVVGEALDYKEEREFAEKLAKEMNDFAKVLSKGNNVEMMTRIEQFQAVMDAAVKSGDVKTFKDYSHKQDISAILGYYMAGKLDDLESAINGITLDDASINDIIALTVKKANESTDAMNDLPEGLQNMVKRDDKNSVYARKSLEEVREIIQKNKDEYLQTIQDVKRIADELGKASSRPLDTEEYSMAVYSRAIAEGKQRRAETLAEEIKTYLDNYSAESSEEDAKENPLLKLTAEKLSAYLNIGSTNKAKFLSSFINKVFGSKQGKKTQKEIEGTDAIPSAEVYDAIITKIDNDPNTTLDEKVELKKKLDDILQLDIEKLAALKEVNTILGDEKALERIKNKVENNIYDKYNKIIIGREANKVANMPDIKSVLEYLKSHGFATNEIIIKEVLKREGLDDAIKKVLQEYLEYIPFIKTVREAANGVLQSDLTDESKRQFGIWQQAFLQIIIENSYSKQSLYKALNERINNSQIPKELKDAMEKFVTLVKEIDTGKQKAEQTPKQKAKQEAKQEASSIFTKENKSNDGQPNEPEPNEPPANNAQPANNVIDLSSITYDSTIPESLEKLQNDIQVELNKLSNKQLKKIANNEIEVKLHDSLKGDSSILEYIRVMAETMSDDVDNDADSVTPEVEEDLTNSFNSNDSIGDNNKSSSYNDEAHLNSCVITRFIIGKLKDWAKRMAVKYGNAEDQKYNQEMENLGAFDAVDSGGFAAYMEKHPDTKIRYAVLNGNNADNNDSDLLTKQRVLLVVELKGNEHMSPKNKDAEITLSNGKRYQVVGCMGANSNVSASRMVLATKNSVYEEYESNKNSIKDSDKLYVSENYYNKVAKDASGKNIIYSGRIVKTNEENPNVELKSLKDIIDEAHGDFIVAVKYPDGFKIMKAIKGAKTTMPSKKLELKNGSVWLGTKGADGTYYFTHLEVARFNKDYYDKHKDDKNNNSAINKIRENLRIILNPDTNKSQKLEAKAALQKILYFYNNRNRTADKVNANIIFDYEQEEGGDGKVKRDSQGNPLPITIKLMGNEIVSNSKENNGSGKAVGMGGKRDFANADKDFNIPESIDEQIENVLEHLTTMNLRFQIKEENTKEIKDFKETLDSDLLSTDLLQLQHVNASFELELPILEDSNADNSNVRIVKSDEDAQLQEENAPVIKKAERNNSSHIDSVEDSPIPVQFTFIDKSGKKVQEHYYISEDGTKVYKIGINRMVEVSPDSKEFAKVVFAYDSIRIEEGLEPISGSSASYYRGYKGDIVVSNVGKKDSLVIGANSGFSFVKLGKIVIETDSNGNMADPDLQAKITAVMHYIDEQVRLSKIKDAEIIQPLENTEPTTTKTSIIESGDNNTTNIIIEEMGNEYEYGATKEELVAIIVSAGISTDSVELVIQDLVDKGILVVNKDVFSDNVIMYSLSKDSKEQFEETIVPESTVSEEESYEEKVIENAGDTVDLFSDNEPAITNNDENNETIENEDIDFGDIDLDDDDIMDSEESTDNPNALNSKTTRDSIVNIAAHKARTDIPFSLLVKTAAEKSGLDINSIEVDRILKSIINKYPIRMADVKTIEDFESFIEELAKC